MAGELPEDANREGPSPALWGAIEKLIWQGDFQGRFDDVDWMRQMYDDRIETIKNTVPAERLTVWERGQDGWEPICEALGVEVPDKPFPRLHDTNEFRRIRAAADSGIARRPVLRVRPFQGRDSGWTPDVGEVGPCDGVIREVTPQRMGG
jgi:hypothetical protein